MKSVMIVFGTRPEAIKLAPLIRALEGHLNLTTVVTGQHRTMLDDVLKTFDVRPTHDLNIHKLGQDLPYIVSTTMDRLRNVVAEVKPDAIVVQGDTSSALAAAITAFYMQVPLVHLEAGLRSNNLRSPFPEEGNRKLISQIASLHLAATALNRANLEREGVRSNNIVVTGNTVIDALMMSLAAAPCPVDKADTDTSSRHRMLVTLHRRENLREPIDRVVKALRVLAADFPELEIVLPMHPNPIVRHSLVPALGHLPNVVLTEPLNYEELTTLLSRSTLVLTDSGGIQEEAPALGVPVLVARDTTERPEGIAAGTARLVGLDESHIVEVVRELLTNSTAYETMAHRANPYGDGTAARRAADAVRSLLDGSALPGDFVPTGPMPDARS